MTDDPKDAGLGAALPFDDPETLTVEEWTQIITGLGTGPGRADVITIGPDPLHKRAVSFVVTGLALVQPDGTRYFKSVHVISPPTWKELDVRAAASDLMQEMGVTKSDADTHATRVNHHKLQQLRSEDVLVQIKACGDQSVIYLPSAADYRYANEDDPGGVGVRAWVANFARLARDVLELVFGTQSYVMLDAGRFSPGETASRKVLEALQSGYVGLDTSPTATRLLQTVVGVEERHATTYTDALADISEAESELVPASAALLRAIALYKADRRLAAWNVLSPRWEELLELTSNEQATRLDMARIANDGGASAEARRALESFEPSTADVGQLEKALFIASSCKKRDLEARIVERLQNVFPHSRGLGTHLVTSALRRNDYAELSRLVDDIGVVLDESERSYLRDVAKDLSATSPDYGAVARNLASQHPERASDAVLLCAYEAARHSDFETAFALATSLDPASSDGKEASQLAVDVFEEMLMLRDEHRAFVFSNEELTQIIAILAQRIAIEPRNVWLRTDFARVMSVEVLGSRGTALLAFLMTRFATKPKVASRGDLASPSDEEVTAFFDLALEQFKTARMVVLGAGRLPDTFDADRAKRLLSALPNILSRMLKEITDENGIRTATMMLHAALLVCDRAGDRSLGAALLRMAAIHLANAGWPQDARDMAEHALALAEDSATELRAAWCTYADVYHRIGNIHEALTAMLLALSFEAVEMDVEEAWHEGYLLTRLLRDLGLVDAADIALNRASTVLGTLRDAVAVRIESIRLSIEERRYEHAPLSDDRLLTLIQRLSANLREAIRLEDDILPPLVLLVQLVARARNRALDVSGDIDVLLSSATALVPPAFAQYIRVLARPAPSLADIELLTRAKTRFADDVGYDIKSASQQAKRALVHADTLPIGEALALLELLTDRAVVDLSGGTLVDLERNKTTLLHLTSRGHQVHVIGIDERQRMVRLTATRESADFVTFEPEAVFSMSEYIDWKKKYPFDYAFMDGSEDVMRDTVRRSLDQLGIDHAPASSTVIVSDVELQPLPMNLLRYREDFIGALQPVSTIPSLHWLADGLAHPRENNGRLVAWVSDALPDDIFESVLYPLADRLEPVLVERGVTFTRAEKPPAGLRSADLAIVVAHGGLVPEERYFQVLRDDNQKRWSPRQITAAIGQAGIAVMFVCSSGRHDEHPRARATIGLARRLLANGCRAVVACPWPLAAQVPPRWLPVFLEQLFGGARVTDAVFAANQEVAQRFSGNPPHAFAMHLYGDPDVKLTPLL